MSALATVSLKLNLGCSDSHLPGFLNVDLCEPADVVTDLSKPWPWPDSSVEAITAWDIFEHLPNKKFTMNEAHRVLVWGGRLDLFVPTTDGRGAFQDPTHQSFWTPNDLFYWCDQFAEWKRFRKAYGITARFLCIGPNPAKEGWQQGAPDHREYPDKVWKLRAILEAVK